MAFMSRVEELAKQKPELVSCLAYSSTAKIDAKCFSETSLEFQRATILYNPEIEQFCE